MFFYVKATHIVSIVSWFAGLFYLVRLFIYHTEAIQLQKNGFEILHEQFQIMEKRLWQIITFPASILTLFSGISMLYIEPGFLTQGWLHVKLSFVLGLFFYQFKCLSLMKKLAKGTPSWTSTQLRLWNELATVLLVAIVFLVVLKSMLSMVYGIVGLLILGIVLMLCVKVYKKNRGN